LQASSRFQQLTLASWAIKFDFAPRGKAATYITTLRGSG
jgi:hypothetical protein